MYEITVIKRETIDNQMYHKSDEKKTTLLLKQNVEDLDLIALIKVINKIGETNEEKEFAQKCLKALDNISHNTKKEGQEEKLARLQREGQKSR